MMFTTEEKRLLNLYRSGSAADTAAVVHDAMPDINEPDERAAAESVLRKLADAGDSAFDCLADESGVFYE